MPYAGGDTDKGIARHWRPPAGDTGQGRGGLSEGALVDLCTDVDGLWGPAQSVRPESLVTTGAAYHPWQLAYRVDALTRLRRILDLRPDWTGAAWSAGSAWGAPYFCDDADTCVLSRGRRRLTSAEWSVRRREPKIVARPDLDDPALRLALQCDGAAHFGLERRDRDSKVNTQLANPEWHVLRVAQKHLADPDLPAEAVDAGMEVCRRRLGGRG